MSRTSPAAATMLLLCNKLRSTFLCCEGIFAALIIINMFSLVVRVSFLFVICFVIPEPWKCFNHGSLCKSESLKYPLPSLKVCLHNSGTPCISLIFTATPTKLTLLVWILSGIKVGYLRSEEVWREMGVTHRIDSDKSFGD